jgi:hypothetical protein
MVQDQFSNLLSSYILIDASDPDQNWETICSNIIAWQISIGTFHPCSVDKPELKDGDVRRLFQYARILLTDRDEYVELSKSFAVPYVRIDNRELEEVMEEVDALWYARH